MAEAEPETISNSRAMQELSTRLRFSRTRLAARQQALEAGIRAVSSAEALQCLV